MSPLWKWYRTGLLFCFCAMNRGRVQGKGLGRLIGRKFLPTLSCKTSESCWAGEALRLRGSASEKCRYSVYKLVWERRSLQEMLGTGGKGGLRAR